MGPRDTSKALELRRSTLHAWCWIAKSHLRGAPSAKAGYQAPLSRCTGPGGVWNLSEGRRRRRCKQLPLCRTKILSNASMFGISSALQCPQHALTYWENLLCAHHLGRLRHVVQEDQQLCFCSAGTSHSFAESAGAECACLHRGHLASAVKHFARCHTLLACTLAGESFSRAGTFQLWLQAAAPDSSFFSRHVCTPRMSGSNDATWCSRLYYISTTSVHCDAFRPAFRCDFLKGK